LGYWSWLKDVCTSPDSELILGFLMSLILAVLFNYLGIRDFLGLFLCKVVLFFIVTHAIYRKEARREKRETLEKALRKVNNS